MGRRGIVTELVLGGPGWVLWWCLSGRVFCTTEDTEGHGESQGGGGFFNHERHEKHERTNDRGVIWRAVGGG